MATSQNGYAANDRSLIASYTVPGTTLKIALRKGDVSVVLLEYLRRYHLEVESLYHVPQDLWGYAERTIRGSSTSLSNHASGTAVDARAVKNGLGMTNTFTDAQERALDRLLAWFEGVLRHGKNYSGRKDPMHAEINKGSSAVKRIADKIRRGQTGGGAPAPAAGLLRRGSKDPAVREAQQLLKAAGHNLGLIDGDFGPATEKAVRDFQAAHGLAVDGVIGPATWAALRTEEDDLRDDERLWLQTIYDQITGQDFKGWPTWAGGTDESLSLVDYARRDNVETRQLHHNLTSVHAKLDALSARLDAVEESPPAPASDVTAAQVVDELLRRLKEAS